MFDFSPRTRNLNRTSAKRTLAATIFVAFLILAINTPLPAAMYSRPHMPYKNTSYSLNWSGYAETGAAGSVTSVTGTWTVPTVTASKGQTYVAFWVGIDGYNSNTVEQAGILAASNGKTVSYSAWYEFYPAASQTISTVAVSPGDTVTVSITATVDNSFTITLTEGSQAPFTITQTVANAQRSSAEWIVERPSIGGSITKLANFGTASFSSCSASGTSLSTQIPITMVNRAGQTLASVSSTWNSGSFSVTFRQSN